MQELVFCDDVSIFFIDDGKEYLLYDNDTILWALRCLSSSLEKSLEEKLKLPEFLKSYDIGFMWNTTIHETIKNPDNKSLPSEWQDNYLIWNFKEFALWMYNKNDSIYLQITPVYKWHFIDPKQNEHFISYEKFMDNYKPITTLTLDKKVAQKLLDKAQSLLKKLEKGMAQE